MAKKIELFDDIWNDYDNPQKPLPKNQKTSGSFDGIWNDFDKAAPKNTAPVQTKKPSGASGSWSEPSLPEKAWNFVADQGKALGATVTNLPLAFKESWGKMVQAQNEMDIQSQMDTLASMDRMNRRNAKLPQFPASYYQSPEWRQKAIDSLERGGNQGLTQRNIDLGKKYSSEAAQQIAANKQKAGIKPGSAAEFTFDVGTGIGKTIPALAATMITKNPLPMLAYTGATSLGETYTDTRNQGYSPEQAANRAYSSAAIDTALNVIPVGNLLHPTNQILKTIAKQAAFQGGSAAIAEALKAGVDKKIIDPNMSFKEAWPRIVEAGLSGMATGAVFGAGSHLMPKAKATGKTENILESPEVQKIGEFIQTMPEGAEKNVMKRYAAEAIQKGDIKTLTEISNNIDSLMTDQGLADIKQPTQPTLDQQKLINSMMRRVRPSSIHPEMTEGTPSAKLRTQLAARMEAAKAAERLNAGRIANAGEIGNPKVLDQTAKGGTIEVRNPDGSITKVGATDGRGQAISQTETQGTKLIPAAGNDTVGIREVSSRPGDNPSGRNNRAQKVNPSNEAGFSMPIKDFEKHIKLYKGSLAIGDHQHPYVNQEGLLTDPRLAHHNLAYEYTHTSDHPIHKFMNETGYIRLSGSENSLGVEMVDKPNQQQLEAIETAASNKKIIWDISGADGKIRKSGEAQDINEFHRQINREFSFLHQNPTQTEPGNFMPEVKQNGEVQTQGNQKVVNGNPAEYGIIESKPTGKENPIRGKGNSTPTGTGTDYTATAKDLYPDFERTSAAGKDQILKRISRSQPLTEKAGFSDLHEAHVAMEAKTKGAEWFKETTGGTDQDFRELTGKLKKLAEPERGKLKLDLQFFAMRDPHFKDNAIEKVKANYQKSRFRTNTIARATAIPEEIKKSLTPEEFDYIPETSEKWQNEAVKNVQENREKVISDIVDSQSISGGVQAHEAALITKQLVDEAKQSGDYSQVKTWTKLVAEKTRETARALKGTDTAWEKTKSVEGAIAKAQRVVNNAKDLMKKFRTKGQEPDLTDDDFKFIVDTMEKAKAYPDGSYEQTVEIAKVKQRIAAKLPVSLGEKISAFQTIAQLLNPKTQIRNILGNMAFAVPEHISGHLGTSIDKVVSLYTGKRTKLAPNLGVEVKGFIKGAKEAYSDYRQNIDTSPNLTQFDLPRKQIFKSTVMREIERATGFGLKLGDRPFYQAAFEGSLAEQMKLSGTKEPTKEMIDSAHEVARYRTFQDENAISNFFSRLKHTLNFKNGKLAGTGFGDLVMKYPKTPGNLLARAIDYSPAGFINSMNTLYKGVRYGEFNQRLFVDRLSRATVGTGMFLTGIALYNLGVVSGRADTDKDVNSLNQASGLGQYKINLSALHRLLTTFDPAKAALKAGDKFMTYDWIQPSSVSTSAGVNMAQQLKDRKRVKALDAIGAVVTALEGGVGTLAEQPLVSGISNLFSGFGSGNVVDNLIETAASAPSSFIPTLFNQIKQITDNTKRNVQGNNPVETGINLVKNKVPGLSMTLPEKVNTLGQTQTTYQNNSLVNVLLNPAFTSSFDDEPGVKLVMDIYNRTGDKTHFPRVAPKFITVKGKKIGLTPKQQNKMQKVTGEYVLQRFNDLSKDSFFMSQSDEKKVSRMKAILDVAATKGKRAIIDELQ